MQVDGSVKIVKMMIPGDLIRDFNGVSSVLQFLSSKGVRVLGLNSFRVGDSSYVGVLLSFDGFNGDLNGFVDEVRDRLKRSFEGVFKVYFEDYYWEVLDGRNVILTGGLFKSLFEGLFKTLNVTAPAVSYSIGFEMGCKFHDYCLSFVGQGSFNLVFSVGSTFFSGLGFGSLELVKVDLELGFLQVRVYDSIECRVCRGLKGFRGSSFILGFLEGWFSRFLGKSLYGCEVECVSRGSEYCEFLFQSVCFWQPGSESFGRFSSENTGAIGPLDLDFDILNFGFEVYARCN